MGNLRRGILNPDMLPIHPLYAFCSVGASFNEPSIILIIVGSVINHSKAMAKAIVAVPCGHMPENDGQLAAI